MVRHTFQEYILFKDIVASKTTAVVFLREEVFHPLFSDYFQDFLSFTQQLAICILYSKYLA